jgi:hypothetical protein
MHLTNYSINKKNEDYKFVDKSNFLKIKSDSNSSICTSTSNTTTTSSNLTNSTPSTENAGEGSKRKLTTVFNYMQAKGYNVSKIKSQIDDLVVKTILSLLPEMKVDSAFEPFLKPYRQKTSYFQVF